MELEGLPAKKPRHVHARAGLATKGSARLELAQTARGTSSDGGDSAAQLRESHVSGRDIGRERRAAAGTWAAAGDDELVAAPCSAARRKGSRGRTYPVRCRACTPVAGMSMQLERVEKRAGAGLCGGSAGRPTHERMARLCTNRTAPVLCARSTRAAGAARAGTRRAHRTHSINSRLG